MQTEILIVPTQNLELVVAQSGLDPASADALRSAFAPLFDAAAQWKERVNGLSVTDVSQRREMKLARESRLALKEIRCNAARRCKELKEESLRRSKAIQGIYNVLEYLVAPLEEQLMEMEQFAERKEAARLDAQLSERQSALTYFGYPALDADTLRNMEDDAFQTLLADAKLMAEAKIREAERMEAERVAKERAESEERQRLAVENARLQAEAAAREAQLLAERQAAEATARVIAEQVAAEKRAALATAKASRLAAETKAREEASKREAVARAERDWQAALAAAEREHRMELERKFQAMKDAESAPNLVPHAAATVTIYGASDDLIEIDGALREEFSGGDEITYLAFSDGTVLSIQYADDGCWRVHRCADGKATYHRTEALGPDTDNYSDRVTLTGDLSWCVMGLQFVTTSEF